jgi:tetratricopeptide (TPR) repeat protein
MLVPALVASTAPDIGERFTGIGAEVRSTGTEMSSIGGRIAMIRDALQYGAVCLVFDSGPRTYSSTYFRFRSANFFAADPHSQAMLWLTETGGIGFMAQALLLLAILGLMWIAALRDGGRDPLLVGTASSITGIFARAMLDRDFQSYFLPLMATVFCGAARSALAHWDAWLLGPWRRVPTDVQTTCKLAGRLRMSWRPLVIVGASLSIALATLPATAALAAEKGIAAYKAGAVADAARLFSVSQRLNPLNAEYPYLRAKTNTAQPAGESVPTSDQAIRDGFDRAIALNPWYIEYQIEQARYLLSRGDAKCVAVYENLTRINPGDPGTFTSLAWAYHLLYQKEAKAMQSLDQAFAVDKTYYEAWLVLGRIQEDKGKIPEAMTAHRKAAEGNRADVQALGRLDSLYDENGNAAGAARAAFEPIQRAPDSADAKSVFAAVGLGITLDRASVEGRQVKLVWTTIGKPIAESYRASW